MIIKKNLLGIGISFVSKKDVLEYIIKSIQKKEKKYYIVTPNPEILVTANKDIRYKKVLNLAKLALPDGVGLMLASKFLGISLKEKITGVDLMENLCKEVSVRPITVGFLGGGEGIAVRTAECLKKKYPSLKVSFADYKLGQLDKLGQCDILFVAFGSPKQEFWIANNLNKLPIKVAIGVGGAFDFVSGDVRRAPKLVRDLGFEWLFRLIIQPWRAKRQFSLIEFIFLVIKEKLGL